MKTIQGKTFSLLYNAKEDRMILLVNKDADDTISYWITRRFYFSLLFEFDTVLDTLHIKDKVSPFKEAPKKPINNTLPTTQTDTATQSPNIKKVSDYFPKPYSLLQSVNIRIIEQKNSIVLTFKNENIIVQSILIQKDFINFFLLMKRSYPKNEWGIM